MPDSGHEGHQAGAERPDPFSAQLEAWLAAEGPKTLGGLNEVFAEKSFAVSVIVLMLVPAIPLPTGGITHLFEAITILLGVQMVGGRRTVWLPSSWARRDLGSAAVDKAVPFMVGRVRWFEGFSRPRGARFLASGAGVRFTGLVVIAFAVGAALAPPFSGLDTLPALGAVAVALAMVLDDVVVYAVGLAIGVGGIAVILTIGAALLEVITRVV